MDELNPTAATADPTASSGRGQRSRSKVRLARRLSGAGVAGLVLVLTGTSVGAASPCFAVKGRYDEAVATEGCESPVGLCIAGDYSGSIRGEFFGTATSIVPTADTGTTGVLAFTADSAIQARVRGLHGELTIKNAGVFEPTGDGNIVDLQVVTGGTGDLAGATGAIRASGLFDPTTGSGTSHYEGEICLP